MPRRPTTVLPTIAVISKLICCDIIKYMTSCGPFIDQHKSQF